MLLEPLKKRTKLVLHGVIFAVKGTLARDFHNLFLNFFCIFHVLKDTKRSTANIFEKILKIRTDIQSFR